MSVMTDIRYFAAILLGTFCYKSVGRKAACPSGILLLTV